MAEAMTTPNGIVLKPHQMSVVNWYVAMSLRNMELKKGIMVCRTMGAGKTLTALCTAKALMDAGAVHVVHVVAPNSVQGYWEKTVCEDMEMTQNVFVRTHQSGLKFVAENPSEERMLAVIKQTHRKTSIQSAFLSLEWYANDESQYRVIRSTD
jgi:hypothetical protein